MTEKKKIYGKIEVLGVKYEKKKLNIQSDLRGTWNKLKFM